MANQQIHCTVAFCRYNEHGERCSLQAITVTLKARAGASARYDAGRPEDPACGSYEPQ